MQTNNKLRDALVKAQTALVICEWPDGTRMEGVAELLRQIDAALAEPVKNCDVGTAKEQVKRWRRFCNSMTICGECPCRKSYSEVVTDCFSRWAQMPYEEGGAKWNCPN